MTVDGIKAAIAQLPEYERHSLAAWLIELDYDDWDKQMMEDFSPHGRGIAMVEKINREIAEGQAVSFAEGSEQVKRQRNRPPR